MSAYTPSIVSKMRFTFPLRLNFWLMLGWLALFYYFAYHFVPEGQTWNLFGLLKVLCKAGFWVLFTMFGLATVTVFFSFLLFQFGKKGAFKHVLETGSRGIKSGYVQGFVPLYLKPLLGKLQAVIWYQEGFLPPTFIHKIPIRRFQMKLPVPHIRVYQVREMDLLFLDFMRMYRLPAAVYSVVSFSRHPQRAGEVDTGFLPQQYDEDAATTDNPQYKPGEWLHFKTFESGDDFRRIIWPLYARNRSLYVRQQEPDTIYAQRIQLVAYFDLDAELSKYFSYDFIQKLLNHYKNSLYTLFLELGRNGNEVVLTIPGEGTSSVEEEVREMITAASWRNVQEHYDIPAKHFVIVSAWYPNTLAEALHNAALRGVFVIKLLEKYRILEKNKWYWKWLFRSSPRERNSDQSQLPPKKVLQQLKQREIMQAEAVSRLYSK